MRPGSSPPSAAWRPVRLSDAIRAGDAGDSLGVKRVSLVGSLARSALSMVERADQELHNSGTLSFPDGAISYADMQRRFGS